MAFNGTEGDEITLDQAAAYTAAFRNSNPDEVLAHYFGRDLLLEILAQEDCQGIRIYNGRNSDGDLSPIIVGADTDENDIIGSNTQKDSSNAAIGQGSIPCPSRCSKGNPLNGNI